jgi:hypothetical protein
MAGASIVAKRFKKALPPNLQDDEDNEIPPQAQAAIQQGQQHIQALNAACQHYEGQIKQLEFEKQAKVVDNQAKAQIRQMEIEADITKAEITTKAQNVNERIAFVEDMMKQIMGQSHESAMAAQQAAHAQDAQQQQAATQSQQSAQDAAQQQDAAAQQQQGAEGG